MLLSNFFYFFKASFISFKASFISLKLILFIFSFFKTYFISFKLLLFLLSFVYLSGTKLDKSKLVENNPVNSCHTKLVLHNMAQYPSIWVNGLQNVDKRSTSQNSNSLDCVGKLAVKNILYSREY